MSVQISMTTNRSNQRITQMTGCSRDQKRDESKQFDDGMTTVFVKTTDDTMYVETLETSFRLTDCRYTH